MRGGIVTLWLLAGCGRVAFEATGDGGSGGDDADEALVCTTYDFASGLLPLNWEAYMDPGGCSAAVTNAALEITLAPNTDCYAGASALAAIDMTGARVTVTVPMVTAPTNTETNIALYVDNANAYELSCETDMLQLQRRIADVPVVQTLPYNATQHRHWRIAHDRASNMVVFSTSPDRATWTTGGMFDPTLPVTALSVELAAGSYLGGTGSPGGARFDDFELCLPR